MTGMIVAPQPLAVEEGAKVLMAGGNAIDAAVTCALVQGVIDPHSCGIGGYAILNLHLARQSAAASIMLDAPALAGSRVSEAMWEDLYIRPNPDGWGFFLKGQVNSAGYQSVCVPGTVKALSTILERWGTRDWSEVFTPAITTAEEGFAVQAHLAAFWKARKAYPESTTSLERIQKNPEASRIYLKSDGSPYDTGEHFRNPDYARSLQRLAEHGPEDFYTGALAEQMTADLASNGSFVTAEDFASYQLRDVAAVRGTYHDYAVTSSQPPHGGATLVAILNILEGYDLAALGHNSAEYIYLVSMAMKAAFADRNPHMADPEFLDVPVDWMTSKERAQHWRDHIDSGKPINVDFAVTELPDTTQVTVVDGAGNCVSLTHSLGASSGVITPGMGFMYNNSMINFNPLPGFPNSIVPGKGRTTGMAPTIIYKDDKPVLVVGSPGATRIITGNLQVILNVLAFGMSVSDAVAAPRFDCQDDLIRCQARVPEYVCTEVRRKHPIVRLPVSYGSFSLVHAISIDPQSGALAGGADVGSGGMALAV